MKHKLNYSRSQIYQDCAFAQCVHIAAIPRLYLIAYERSWDQMNYSFQSYYSTDGTITFDLQNGMLVGALRKNDSARMKEYPGKNVQTFFRDADESIYQLAQNEALQYLLMSFEEKVKKSLFSIKTKKLVIPVVTTAFWSEGDDIYSSDDENAFLENGGKYINEICTSKNKLIECLTEYYELTTEELNFAETLFEFKVSGESKLSKELFTGISSEESKGYESFLSALSDFHFEVA